MNPSDQRQPSSSQPPVRSAGSFGAADQDRSRDATINLVRNQINNLLGINSPEPTTTPPATNTSTTPATTPVNTPTQATTPVATPPTQQQTATYTTPANLQYENQQSVVDNPYDRTQNTAMTKDISKDNLQKYHSAWQNYYQQYYEKYYIGKVQEVKSTLENSSSAQEEDNSISQDEALFSLRGQIRQKVETKAKEVRKSRHFMPIMSAVIVVFVFLFLQYNRVLFANVAAYVSPGDMDPASLIVDPSAKVAVGPDPKLIIPKITVDVPIIFDAIASDQNSLNTAMDKGVAWFNIPGANALPGDKGNFVLSGHSSNDWLDKGDYKFIFARLEQLGEGDTIYVNYEGVRYTYVVSKTLVVKPTDVSALTGLSDKPHITLITCTPLGTAQNRLLVVADQVSPDPNTATATPETTKSTEASKMPSNSPTFIQRIFGGSN